MGWRALASSCLTAVLGAVLMAPAPAANAAQAGLVASVPIAGGADAVAASGNVVAVTSKAARTVSVVDATTLAVRWTTPVPLVPGEVILSTDATLAYVLAYQPNQYDPNRAEFNSIYVLDTASGTVVRSASYLPVRGKSCDGTMSLRDLTISPDGRRLDAVAEGCGSNVEIWTIDPVTLAVTKQVILLSGFLVGIGRPIGSMASFDDRLLTLAYVQVFKCPDVDGCPQPDVLVTLTDDLREGPETGPVQIGGTLVRDPVDGKVIAPTPTTKWIDYSPVPATQSLIRFDPVTGAQEGRIEGIGTQVTGLQVDAAARRLYAMRSPSYPGWPALPTSIGVVDLVTGAVLGELPVAAYRALAVGNGRVYLATSAGLEVIDPSRALAPSAPASLKVRIGPGGKGSVKLAVTFRPPVAKGSAAITGYRVDAYAQDPGNMNGSLQGTAKCSTRKPTCTLKVKKVSTSDDLTPAMYSVVVRAANANGLGAAGELSVRAE